MSKGVIHFLWDWAKEQGSWAEKLVGCIIQKESLNDSERREIFELFLHQIGVITTTLSNDTIARNVGHFESVNDKILLQSLSHVKGVNKLAANQEIRFSPNLTVVYGNNGSGKTGYSRILKSLGFSYEDQTKILSNVFDDEQTASSALLKYSIDTTSKEFQWSEHTRSDDLTCIGVFNTECVRLSLDGKRNFIATPAGFHLFNLVSHELETLQNILAAEILTKRTQPRFIEELTKDTEVFIYVSNISHSTKEEEIEAVFSFSEDDELQLQQLETEKQQLNKPLIKNEIEMLKKKITELDSLAISLKSIEARFNKTFWHDHFNDLEMLKVLEGQQEKGIEEIARDKGVAFYQSHQFKNFITAAEDYIKIISAEEYPSDTDRCIYCQQQLDVESKILLASYRQLLNDTTKTDLEAVRLKISKNIQSVTAIKTDLVLNHDSFGLNADNTSFIPDIISKIFNQLEQHKLLLLNPTEDQTQAIMTFNIDYQSAIDYINAKKEQVNALLEAKVSLSDDIERKEKEIHKLLNGLKDSKKISVNKVVIFDFISNLKHAYILEQNKQQLNTRSLSLKSTNARKELIEQRFEDIFVEELKNLRCPQNISLNFGTVRSVPRIEQNIKQFSLQEVFSEGEQKSVALANFITELRVSGKNGPVVFDDPVNSLDHERISIVAKRLINLSLERQTIIFTHNVLLFYAIEQIIKDSKIKLVYNYYTVEKDLNFTGYLYENVPPHKESYRTYEAKINGLLNTSKEERTQRESKLAQEGYNHLRSAIELLVEDEIFRKVVKRYKRNITFGQFEEINGANLDAIKQELTEVFHQCCSYIEAHSNPEELAELPTLEQLQQDFLRIKQIKSLFQ